MPDRVKESIFDMLGSHYDTPGMLPALAVADVFAGGGSMGLEAMSRGAASCCFYERGRPALDALKKNLLALGAGAAASVVSRNAWTASLTTSRGRPFDLVFLDPPYVDSTDTSPEGAVRRYLQQLAQLDDVERLVVFHHHASVKYSVEADDDWSIIKQRVFGTNCVTFFRL
jgi:16S rRNA (guanine(966)-N(2))-methyltransferase RsmD